MTHHRHRRIRHGVRLAHTHEWLLHLVVTGLTVSGVGWLVCHYLLARETDFGRLPHPWEGGWLATHGAFAMVGLVAIGSLSVMHMLVAWHLDRNRLTGGTMALLSLWLALSGYLLYYVGDEERRALISVAHWLPGIIMPLALLLHIWRGTRRILPLAPERVADGTAGSTATLQDQRL